MSINQFVEMTVFLCLTRFSIYDKMQGFLDESCVLHRNSKWPAKVAGKRFLRKNRQ